MLEKVTIQLINALENFDSTVEEINNKRNSFFKAVKKSTSDEIEKSMQLLADLFPSIDLNCATQSLIICGCLIEQGYNPQVINIQLKEHLEFSLKDAYQFFLAAKKEIEKYDSDDDEFDAFEILENLKESLQEELQDEIFSWNALEHQYCVFVSACSLDRQLGSECKQILEHYQEMSEYNSGVLWLAKLFSVLYDAPILVIDPMNKLGFIGKMGGIVTNFQLHTILLDVFPYKKPSKEKRISKTDASIAKGLSKIQQRDKSIRGAWDLHHWTAITKDFSLPKNNAEYWIWNEGKPSDIQLFENYYTILLRESSYNRTWGSQRTFAYLKAEMEVIHFLSENDVDNWLAKMWEKKNEKITPRQ